MDKITVENFRCFRRQQRARLAPLTLLVGENSSGKTSFLALIRALWDAAYGNRSPDFKEDPYDLGSFDEIAHFRGGRGGRSAEFHASFTANPPSSRRSRRQTNSSPLEFDITFAKKVSAPSPVMWRRKRGFVSYECDFRTASSPSISVSIERGRWKLQDVSSKLSTYEQFNNSHYPLFVIRDPDDFESYDNSPQITKEDIEALRYFSIDERYSSPSTRPFASAPVRSRPRRTYDQNRPMRDPEGENVPMYLSMISAEQQKSWSDIKVELEKFGRSAGLFDEISIKIFGTNSTEPFHIQVRKYGTTQTKGPMRNLIDMGYGVSQVLPVVVELFRQDAPRLFLLQQPEVHLHPSAQAALGTLFCNVVSSGRQLIVETHGDYLIDRVRTDVRDNKVKLRPEDVCILYFKRGDLDVTIHTLGLDKNGNVVGAPNSYRKFLMDELGKSFG